MAKVGVQIVHIGRALALPAVFLDDSIEEIYDQIVRRAEASQTGDKPIVLLEKRYISLIIVYAGDPVKSAIVSFNDGKMLLSDYIKEDDTIKFLLLVTLPDILVTSEQLAKTPKLLSILEYKKYSIEKVYANQDVYVQIINQEYNTKLNTGDTYIEYLYNKLVAPTSEAERVLEEIQYLNKQRIDASFTSNLDINLYDPLTGSQLSKPLDDLVVTGTAGVALEHTSQIEMTQRSELKGRESNYINIVRLFEIYQLDEIVPFVGLSKKYSPTKEPMFRLHNSLKETTKVSDIKTWMVKEIKKKGELEYKHIPEITFRHKINLPISRSTPYYLTITLNQKGTVSIGLETELKKLSGSLASTLVTEYLSEIPYDVIIQSTNAFIEKLNKMPIFRSQNRINKLERSKLVMDEYSTRYYTKRRINKTNLKIFLQLLEKNKLLKYNSIVSDEAVSMIYKPVYMENAQVTDYTSWNVNINVYDNKRLENSSIIHISRAPSMVVARNILYLILLIGEVSERGNQGWFDRDLYESDSEEQKLYRQTNIKELKAQGGIIDSRNCQEYRRPVLYKNTLEHQKQKETVPDGYLDYNNVEYICTKPDYPYVGFTTKGVVCCFKKSQKHKPIYKQMLQTSETVTLVRPSNVLINIVLPNEEVFKTYPLKQITGDESELGYYYFDPLNVYTRITDQNVIQMLNFMDFNMWLKEVQLYDLTIAPLKTLCSATPDITVQSMDVNAKCRQHAVNNKFGYTSNSIPCCFAQIGDTGSHGNSVSKEYIKKTQTVLTEGTKGYILESSLLGKFLRQVDPETRYLRYGLRQDNDTLFHATRLALKEYPTEKIILSGNEMRQVLARYILNDVKNNESKRFNALNNGTLASEYTPRMYIQLLLGDTRIPESQILDLMTEYFDTTFLVYDTMQNYIVCTPDVNIKVRSRTVILLRYLNPITKQVNYELLGTGRRAVFSMQDTVVRFLLDYYSKSCKKTIEPLDGYTPPPSMKKVLNVLDRYGKTPKKQILNRFNQVYLLSTEYGIIPVEPSRPLEDILVLEEEEVIKNTKLDYNRLVKHQEIVEDLFKKVGEPAPYKLKSKVVIGGKAVGIALSTGIVLPIVPSDPDSVPLEQSGVNWYYGEDEAALYYGDEAKDTRLEFYNIQKSIQEVVDNVKKELVKHTEEMQKDIGKYKTIMEDTTVSQFEKIKKIEELLEPILNGIYDSNGYSREKKSFTRHLIAKEILQDPYNMSLIYGILPDVNTDENSKKLIEMMDIRNYFKELEKTDDTLERVIKE